MADSLPPGGRIRPAPRGVPGWGISLVAAGVLLSTLPGCVVELGSPVRAQPGPSSQSAQDTAAGQSDGAGGISLRVARAPGGSVLLFVPVSIQGEGPFDFVLDTGASRTVVDRQLAERLKLSEVPAISQATDVSGAVQASVVRIADWRIGQVALGETIAASIDLQDPQAGPLQQFVGERLYGLLGSDVLSGFGVVTIDYERGELRLGR